jgi:threonyl-tRNA synthetase
MSETGSSLHAMRHSAAHVMANAVQHLWPSAKFGVGPVIDDGFYYDIDLDDAKFSDKDFSLIEKEMKKIIEADEPFEQFDMDIDKAIDWAQQIDQPYKVELLKDLARAGTTKLKDLDISELGLVSDKPSAVKKVSFYRNGDFTDLCRGPHVESTGKIGAFKLLRVAGAYWRGIETNPQMQRIYGLAFPTKEELNNFVDLQEEAKKRDHRKIGQELDLFVISDIIGSGLPLFTPRGTILRNELIRYSEELQLAAGYMPVWTPHITRTELYKISGHYEKFPERFSVSSSESGDDFMMKPMNCPHVTQIYASRPRSYRELPLRYMETTTMYRDEKSGELHGLSRVRALTQDDAHVFCRPDQIEEELTSIMNMVKEMYKVLDLPLRIDLSFRDDSDAYLGEKKDWDDAQAIMEKIAKKQGIAYKTMPGEAAFYGPKIDIYIADALGREWQCATIQLDFVQPARFGLEYATDTEKPAQPVMIHKALLGSIERFLSVYIEHTGGRFPVWLAPEQFRILTLNQQEKTVKYATEVMNKAKLKGLRVSMDNSNESVGKKIRNAELMKIPYVVVIGEQEISSGEFRPRIREDLKTGDKAKTYSLEKFIETIAEEALSRKLKSTL